MWGHINLVANGAGQAIAQLDVNWGVDYEPFKVIITTSDIVRIGCVESLLR